MSEPPSYTLTRGESCLVVSVPHAGTFIPQDIAARLTPAGLAVVDTDWHVDRLAAFATGLGATLLVATHSRTVIDLNRARGGALLYPGKVETGLLPTETFAGDPLYRDAPPDPAEADARTARYWQPYHNALQTELARVKSQHGRAHLLDLHSIASCVPRLFDGRLPDLNIGTNDGTSADPTLIAAVVDAVRAHPAFTMVLDGRFKGGAITRTYGRPAAAVHAIQLEISQSAYMDETSPHHLDEVLAQPLVDALRSVVETMLRINAL
jgi:N-formylglutamate deformylase